MKKDEGSDGMWCVVMFDLPVETKAQRRAATQFRDLLLDQGFMMVQFSVYARYTPTLGGNRTSGPIGTKRGVYDAGQAKWL